MGGIMNTNYYKTTYHRNGTVTVWNIFKQGWERLAARDVCPEILATLTQSERDRIAKMAAK